MDPEPEPDPDPDPAYLARSGPEPDPVKILDPVEPYRESNREVMTVKPVS